MNALEFALDPAGYGLPTREQLKELRIWDLHYHGLLNSGKGAGNSAPEHEGMLFYIERMGIERVFALDIGGTRRDPLAPSPFDAVQRRILEEQKERVSGLIRIDPSEPDRSCRKMEQWIRNGPCVGIKYAGFGNKDNVRCDHPNNDPIIRCAVELNAIIYVHTWLKVGGQPRRPGGGNLPGENSPLELIELSRRFPGVRMICGHGGGDWEVGARMVRPHKDLLFEFAGSDPQSGQVDFAVRELGAERIVWGGHGPSRAYATELSKVMDAGIAHAQRVQILGGNLRQNWSPIFKQKGYRL
ncbi:MAG: amidohydrolase family protein [Verrucomicrobiota bacterium]|nr:amidohydrolase family protein [Verrucomicrobiota bacterium]